MDAREAFEVRKGGKTMRCVKLLLGLAVLVAMATTVEADLADVPEEWKSKTMAELVQLADQLLQDESANASDLQLLGEYVADGYPTIGQVAEADQQDWLVLIGKIGAYIPGDAKQAMTDSIASELAADDAAVASLSVEWARAVGDAWDALGQEQKTSEMYATWVVGSDAFKSLEASELVWYTGALVRFGLMNETVHGKISDHIETAFLSSTDETTAVGLPVWKRLVGHLKPRFQMPAETRSDWSARLRAAFADDQQTLESLSGDQMATLLYVLSKLQDEGLPALLARWVDVSDAWQTWSMESLLRTESKLLNAGEDGRGARRRIALHFEATYLTDETEITSVSPTSWRGLLNSVASDLSESERATWKEKFSDACTTDVTDLLGGEGIGVDRLCTWVMFATDEVSEETRVAWIDEIRSRFGGTAASGFSLAEIRQVASTLAKLGDALSLDIVAAWAGSADLSRVAAEDLPDLAKSLADAGIIGSSARSRLVSYIEAEYLSSEVKTAEMGAEAWGLLARSVASDLSQDQRQLWVTKLLKAFDASDDQSVAALNASRVAAVADAVAALDDIGAAELSAKWFTVVPKGTWSGEKPKHLARVARHAFRVPGGHSLDKSALAADLDAVIEPAHEQRKLGTYEYETLARAYLGHDRQKAQEWAMRLYSRALGYQAQKPSLYQLGRLAHLMNDVGLVGKGKGYTAFATALANLARTGKLNTRADGKLGGLGWQRRKLGYPVAAPEARGIVEAELLDDQGLPRIEVARILAWAYRKNEELDAWCQLVDQKLADPETSSDQKALWLLVKGHAASLRPASAERNRQWPYFAPAIAAAQSENVKVQVLIYITGMHNQAERWTAGITLLQSVKNQFAGDSLKRVERMESYLAARKTKSDAEDELLLAQGELLRKQTRLAHYRRLLERARAANDTKAISNLEPSVQQLEAELAP
jgi:hypothetical protein